MFWTDCLQPNGVVLSPNGKTAYITDTGLFRPETRTSPHTIYAYDVVRTECAAVPTLLYYLAVPVTCKTLPHTIRSFDVVMTEYACSNFGVQCLSLF